MIDPDPRLDPVLAAEPVLLDGCVVLSLYATGIFEAILAAAAPGAVVSQSVVREALYVYRLVAGARTRVPVDLGTALSVGLLSVTDFTGDDEAAAFIDLAVVLDDGEAASAAIALHRGWCLATDDRKAIEVVGERITIVGSLDLVRAWSISLDVPGEVLRGALGRIRDRGYVPGRAHPHRPWWDRSIA